MTFRNCTSAYLVALTIFGSSVATASVVECNVDAFEAYDFANRQRSLAFQCAANTISQGGRVAFRASREEGLVCAGKTSADTSKPARFTANLFGTPGNSIWTGHGWVITGYSASIEKSHRQHRRDFLISHSFAIRERAAEFSLAIRSITFKKTNGDCSNVLREAFDIRP